MMNFVKIYGERNTGTNYLEQLILNNLEVEVLRYFPNRRIEKYIRYEIQLSILFELKSKKYLGWKHGNPRIQAINKFNEGKLLIITITKNPYSYLLSLYKRPYHYKGDKNTSFKNFLACKWKTIFLMENSGKKFYKNPIEIWNEKNNSYLNLRKKVNKEVLNIRYEDLLANPEEVMLKISRNLGVKIKNEGGFKNILSSTKLDDKKYDDYKRFYLSEKWKEELTYEAIELINVSLDFELLKRLNYEKL